MLENLLSFYAAVQRSSRGEFVEMYPDSVFVVQPFAPSESGMGGISTVMPNASAGTEPCVARVRKREGANSFGMMVTMGRAANNDIYIPAKDVSKFHAYVMFGPDGPTLTDAESTFGTFLGSRKLTPQSERAALAEGAEVRLGSVRLTYYSPQGFHNWLLTHEL